MRVFRHDLWHKHSRVRVINDLSTLADVSRLIAIMLGILEMTVDDAISAFTKLSKNIFGTRISNFPVSIVSGKIQARYDTDKVDLAITEVTTSAGKDKDMLMRGPKSPNNTCKV